MSSREDIRAKRSIPENQSSLTGNFGVEPGDLNSEALVKGLMSPNERSEFMKALGDLENGSLGPAGFVEEEREYIDWDDYPLEDDYEEE